MLRLASLIWIMLGTTLAGIALMVILLVPQFAGDSMRLIPIVCGAAALLAMPISVFIASRVQAQAAR